MSGYQAASTAALAATPHTGPAPRIVKADAQNQVSATSWQDPPQFNNPLQGLLDQLQPLLKSLGIEDGQVAHDPMISNQLTTFVSQILQNFGVNWNPGAGTLNGQVYDYYADASQPIWYLARSLELFEDFLNIAQNPGQAIQALQYIAALALFDWPTHIAQLASTVSQSPALLAAATGAIVAPVGAASGLAGLAGLAALPHSQPVMVPVAAPVAPSVWPASATTAAFAAPGTAPGSAPSPAPAASTVAGSAPPPTSPSAGATGFVAPYAVGPPSIGFGSGLGIGASSTDRRRAPKPDVAAATAASQLAMPRQRRTRRHRRWSVLASALSSSPPFDSYDCCNTIREQQLLTIRSSFRSGQDRHQLRLMNSRPSSFLAQSTIGSLLRNVTTARSTAAGSPRPNVATAATTSHSSL